MPKKDLVVEISYCPELGIYHYTRSDGDEFFWDNVMLEQTIEAYLRQGKMKDAEFMARVTTAARETPHKVVVFHGDGTVKVKDPVVPEWVPKNLSQLKSSDP